MRVMMPAGLRPASAVGADCCARARPRLLPVKDTHDLGFKFREFDGEHSAAGMKDEIEAGGEQIDMAAQGLAHAALDAIALVGLAEHFACGEADAAGRHARRSGCGSQKPAHRSGLALAARRISALIVSVFAQTHARQRLA